MDTNTQATTEGKEPRRSGRQRRQAESIYADARLAERKNRAAMKDKTSSERSMRYKKRKRKCATDDSVDEEENDEDSTTLSDEEMGQFSSDSEEEEDKDEVQSKTMERPTIISAWEWTSSTTRSASNERALDSFSSVDGDRMFCFYRYNWNGDRRCSLSGGAGIALEDAQISLTHAARIVDRDITLDSKPKYLSQVPYHADMMPCYEYFAHGIQRRTSPEVFKIINYNLPQSPWLATKILPVLEQNRKLKVLELSNCSLTADDLKSVTKFISENKTLSSLNISHSIIGSVDTVKALANALKKHPALRKVNLSYCSLAGGHSCVEKILSACKKCDTLDIGHKDFDSKCVEKIANFLGKKHSLTSFSLVEASVDKGNKKLLSDALTTNKTIQKIRLRANGLQLPAIIRNTKKARAAFGRLTSLDISFNSFPVQRAKVMSKFLEDPECSLRELIMSNNHLTTKGANALLPALKKNTSLQSLDMSRNWLNDQCAPAVIDMLLNNTTLLSLDLSKNNSLRARYLVGGRRRRWRRNENQEGESRTRDGGRAKIVKGGLFDLTSLESLAACNHTCAVTMSGCNLGNNEETIRRINALEVSETRKIRHKVVLALNVVKKDLYESCNFNELPLEMMPYLLEMLQQRLSPSDFPRLLKRRGDATTLSRLYDAISTWQTPSLLFNRGPGKRQKKGTKKNSKPRKRRKFGDEEDEDDDAWIPKGARKTGKSVRNPETGNWEWIPPPVY